MKLNCFKKTLPAALAIALTVSTASGLKAQAAPAYDSRWTQTVNWESAVGPSFLYDTNAAGVYEQLKLGLRTKVMSEGDIFHLFQMQETKMPLEAIRLLYENELISGYLYKTLAGLPYEAKDLGAVFDAEYYKNANPAILTAVQQGTLPGDEASLFANFLAVGMPLGLRACEEFDPAYFRAANPALDEAFGTNNMQYYIYYILYGQFQRLKAHE